MTMPRILCCSLFPALQRTLSSADLALGRVNRVQGVTETVGGKAVNTARVLKTLGAAPLLAGLSGGMTGHRIEALLAEEDLPHVLTPVQAPSRICQTLLAENLADFTELAEQGVPPTMDELETLRKTVAHALVQSDAMVLSGTLPASADPSCYAALLPPASDRPLLIDTPGQALLQALQRARAIVKINAVELRATFPDASDIAMAAGRLLQAGASLVGITEGAAGARLFTPERAYRFEVPLVQAANGLGSGDAVNAGFILGLLRGETPPDAFAFGLACGTANAMQPTPGTVDLAVVTALLPRVLMDDNHS